MSVVSQFNKKHGKPFLGEYQEKYGDDSVPSYYLLGGFDSPEELCKYCIQNNCRWEDVVELPEGKPVEDYYL